MRSHTFYSNDKQFFLIDFQQSHNEILFRCPPQNGSDYNIDIMFKGVNAMNIVTKYVGLRIDAVDKNISALTVPLSWIPEEYVFRLSDLAGLETYLFASAFGVFKNYLAHGITSLGDFMWSKDNECLLWSHENDNFKSMFNIK